MTTRPGVSIGVIVLNPAGQILIGKRIGSHAPYCSIPGSSLELGENFEHAAFCEIQEEHVITIREPKFITVTND